MNKVLLAFGLTVLAMQSYASEQLDTTEKSSNKMRSDCSNHDRYARWQESKLTAEVHQAFNRFQQNIESDSPIKQVLQTRAINKDGRYFAFEVELENGQIWHGNIHHNPRGDYLIDAIPHEGFLCP